MKSFFLLALSLAVVGSLALARGGAAQTAAQQPRPAATPAPQPAAPTATQTPAQPARRPAGLPASRSFDLGEYGVQFSLEPRLVVMMAALDAAGFDPTPGRQPSGFRARVRADQQNLDPKLRERLQRFYESHKLRESATPAEQAARYVSLAFALGAPPTFDPPPSADDLFEGTAEVLDFAPVLRDFYRASGIESRLPAYLAEYRAEGDLMRPRTREMVKSVLDYLHTRPVTTTVERTRVRTPAVTEKKKSPQTAVVEHERDRRFLVVPDLLAPPGAINLRVVADDYYVVVPAGTDPANSEVRRAYLRFVVDPLVIRFNRDIALKRADIQSILDARAKASGAQMPAVFETVARSLVVAADARMTAAERIRELSASAAPRAQGVTVEQRSALTKEVQGELARIGDEMIATLAEAYERGAVLAFYFSDQLRDQESSGFDFADVIPDVIARVDPAREIARPSEYAPSLARAVAAREKAAKEAASRAPVDEQEARRRAELISRLDDVSRMLAARKYPEAEERLRGMLNDYKGEPRVFFALGQTWSVGAEDAANEETRDARLNNALANYANAIQMADRDNDLALISRAHVARGRILAFLERKDEALQEFDAAIKIGEAGGDAYRQAVEERKKLQP